MPWLSLVRALLIDVRLALCARSLACRRYHPGPWHRNAPVPRQGLRHKACSTAVARKRRAGVCCIIHPFCFSCALFPSELLERSSKRSGPLARSCPVLLSFFVSSLAVASRKPSAARSPAFDDFRSLFI